MALEGPTFILQVLSGSFASVPLVLGGAGNRVIIHTRLQCRPSEEMPALFIAWGLVRSPGGEEGICTASLPGCWELVLPLRGCCRTPGWDVFHTTFEGVRAGIFGFPPAAPCFLLGLVHTLLLEGLFGILNSYK